MSYEYEVTIGIPVFNMERYIRRAMDSVLNQTFESIEFLVCDDCGTDSSIEIVREYQKIHPRGNNIRIISQPYNMGLGEARNFMIENARGRFIYFMDSDDSIENSAIDLLYSAAIKYSAELVYGSQNRIEENDGEKKLTKLQYKPLHFAKEDEFANYVYRKYDGIQAHTTNILIDIEIFKKYNIRYKPLNFWEDFTTTMDLPTYVSRVVLLSECTYNYYCRKGSISNSEKTRTIAKEDILKTIRAFEEVKSNSARIKGKNYFPKRMYKLMMTHFYMVCAILKDEKMICPSFSKREIHDIMRSPLSITEIFSLRCWRIKNLFLYSLGVVPPVVSVFIIRLLGKYKKLI